MLCESGMRQPPVRDLWYPANDDSLAVANPRQTNLTKFCLLNGIYSCYVYSEGKKTPVTVGDVVYCHLSNSTALRKGLWV